MIRAKVKGKSIGFTDGDKLVGSMDDDDKVENLVEKTMQQVVDEETHGGFPDTAGYAFRRAVEILEGKITEDTRHDPEFDPNEIY